MRKAKKQKMKLKNINKMLKDPVMRFQMSITNRAIILLKMGESETKVHKLIGDEQKTLADRIKDDLGDLGLTDKAFDEMLLTKDELTEVVIHAKEIIKEMEAKN
jgi:hypothetical protein